MKPILFLFTLMLPFSVIATNRVFFITSSGVYLSGPEIIYLGDTLFWGNMTGHPYNISGRFSSSGEYPFYCDAYSSGPCKYIPPVAGSYTFFCNSPDETSFAGSFTVTNPTAIIESKIEPELFTCSPNPSSSQLHFTAKGFNRVVLYNLLGVNVAEFNFSNTGTMDVSQLPTGTYIVSAISSFQHTTQRIIIVR